MGEASITTTAAAAQALDEAFRELPFSEGDTFVLVYLDDQRTPDGSVPAGFRPGHIPWVWPPGYASSDWASGRLPSGVKFSLVPRSLADRGAGIVIDTLDRKFDTFSVTHR